MITFQELELHDVVFYKHAKIKLDHVGITVIHGRNRDASRESESNNGSGKSLLWDAIPQLRYGNTPIVQSKSQARKDLFVGKSKIGLKFNTSESNITATKSSNGKSTTYELFRDDKPLKVRTQDYAKQKLEQLLPWSEEEFYTLIYINSRRPSIVQMGTAANRMAFFTGLHKLDNYDELRKVFNGLMKELKDERIILSEIESELDSLASLLNNDIEVVKSEYGKLLHSNAKLNKQYKSLNGKRTRLSVVKSHKHTYQQLCTWDKFKLDRVYLTKLLKALRTHIQQLETDRKSVIEHDKFLSKVDEYEERSRQLVKEIQALKPLVKSISNVDVFLENHQSQIAKYKHKQKILRQKIEEVDNQLSGIKTSDVDATSVKRVFKTSNEKDLRALKTGLDKSITRLTVQVRGTKTSLNEFRSHFESHDVDCPTCFTSLSQADIKRIDQSIDDKLESLTSKLGKQKAWSLLLEEYLINVDNNKLLKELIEKRKQLGTSYAYVEQKLKPLLGIDVKKLQQYSNLVSELARRKPPKFNGEVPKYGLAKIDKMLRDMNKRVSSLEHFIPIADKFIDIPEDIDAELSNVTMKLKTVESRVQLVVSKIPSLKSTIDTYESNTTRKIILEKRKREIEKKVKDLPIYEMLIDAYSNKGLKMLMIRRITGMIERNMNLYAKLVYKEKFRFKFVVDTNKFDILAIRDYNNKKVTSDVRTLSGAESRAFNILFPLAILPLIPASRRTNIMVLDEPTANMDPPNVEHFIHNFIPKLNKIIPHLIIVTPLKEQYVGARVFTAVKERGETKLIEGYVK